MEELHLLTRLALIILAVFCNLSIECMIPQEMM